MTQQNGTGGGDDSDGHRGGGGDPADLLTRQLGFIKATVRKVGHRQRLDASEVEEFEGDVLLKLCDRDYAVLRAFQGRSLLTTYLVTVINRAFLDYRFKKWGKLRPSITATRLGPRAVLLERMVRIEGRPIEEVEARLAASGEPVDRETLVDLLAQLPLRSTRRVVDRDTAIETLASPHDGPGAGLDETDRQRAARLAEQHLREALASLPADDRAILCLVHASGVSIRRIAERLRMPPRALYSLLQHCYTIMRRHLLSAGQDPKVILDLLGRSTVRIELVELRPSGPGKPPRGPSHPSEGEEPA